MGTAIEWTDEVWNPTTGCTKVSPGCDNCYAERVTNRWKGPGAFDTVVLHPERLNKPLHWRKPRVVFVNSMSDLFHDDVPDEFIADVWHVMAETPQHTYQILTKRHARMRSWVKAWCSHPVWETPLPNVWLGVSVEDQKRADLRLPALLDTPAAVRFLSCEPLLGPLDIVGAVTGICFACKGRGVLPGSNWVAQGSVAPNCFHCNGQGTDTRRVGWVIVGGESGPGHRPIEAEWVRSLRDQCEAGMVPFFFKQWGGKVPKAGGKTLDGREWCDLPGGVTLGEQMPSTDSAAVG